jgi:periplasmic copper chaperone A
MRSRVATICAASAFLVFAPVAAAHVTTSPAEVPVGYGYTQFSIPHGCDGSATTSLSIQIPAGVASVKPEVVPGWEISLTTGELPEPVEIFGENQTEGVTEVTWTGGPLDDAYLQKFGLSFFASESLEGETIAFPTVQACEQGVTRWIETSAEGEEEPEHPAPTVTFVASEGHEHGAAMTAADDTADEHAADQEAMDSSSDVVEAAAVDDSSDGTSAIELLALGLGAAGLAAGLVALVVARRRPRQS